MTCIFCDPADDVTVLANQLAYIRYDSFPVSPGHLLIVPYRHNPDYFDCTAAEREAIWKLVAEGKKRMDRERAPDGFNVGINIGKAAGQSVMHVHIHLIPRYAGDMHDPAGGVRGVIPDKQKY